MKFLATGDLHLGVGDRLDDQERTLDQIADVARDRRVDVVLIAGDVFHRPKPTPAELHVFQRFAQKLADAQIPAIAIVGDKGHDVVNGDEPCALELFASDWLRVSRTPELVKVAGDVAVATLPAVTENRVVAAQGSREGASELAAAMLLETAADLFRHVPDDWPSVLLLHHAIAGAALPNGLPVSDLHKPMLPLDSLALLGFDAVVAGDIHRSQMLVEEQPVFYVGSPMTHDFGEAGFDHGVWIVSFDADSFGAATEFVPLEGRRFVTVDVDLIGEPIAREDGMDETDILAAAIELPVTDAIVRVRYRCTEEQARRVDVNALRGYLHEAGVHRIHQITADVVRATRARAESVDEDLAPLAAVDAYIAAAGVTDLAAGLRDYTTRLLEEVTP